MPMPPQTEDTFLRLWRGNQNTKRTSVFLSVHIYQSYCKKNLAQFFLAHPVDVIFCVEKCPPVNMSAVCCALQVCDVSAEAESCRQSDKVVEVNVKIFRYSPPTNTVKAAKFGCYGFLNKYFLRSGLQVESRPV